MRVLGSLGWLGSRRSSCFKATKLVGKFAVHFRNQLLVVAERCERLAECEEVFKAIVACKGLRNRVFGVLDSAMTKARQRERISFTCQNRVDNSSH